MQGLQVRLDKCCVYSDHIDNARASAQRLSVPLAEDGFDAAGTPLGKPAYVEARARALAERVQKLAQLLKETPLEVQDHMLVLRMSLGARVTHLKRTIPWEQLSGAVAALERVLEDHALHYLDISAEQASANVRAQMRLPLKHGGFGFIIQTIKTNVL